VTHSMSKLMDLAVDLSQKQNHKPNNLSRHEGAIGNAQTEESGDHNDEKNETKAGPSGLSNESDLTITTYKCGEATSVTRIPESALKLVGRFTKACAKVQAKDVNLDEVVRLIEQLDVRGWILEHEHPKHGVRVVVSVGEPCKTLGGVDQTVAPANLKISMYKDRDAGATSTTTISGAVLPRADNVIPARARAAMRSQGVDLDEIVRFSREPSAKGVTILVHEDLTKKEKVVISLE